jgi:hypothetical protein
MTRTTQFLPVVLVVTALLALAPGRARAQSPTPKVFAACYVSSTGTIYLINEPGLRTQCQNDKHVQFSWIDGVPGYDHGFLNGLADDDHPQYLLADGTRPLAGHLHAGGFRIAGLAAGTEAGDAVRFEQAVKGGDAAGGDLAGSYPNPSVAKLRGQAVSGTPPTNGQVLTFAGGAWTPLTPPEPVTATPDNIPNTIVQRDASGGFAAGPVTLGGGRAQVNADGGFVVTGNVGGVGAIPATGAGVRLVWHPGKAALRAGALDALRPDGWDDENVGHRSVAFGHNTAASGSESVAMGHSTTASGEQSTALGFQTTATRDRSTALGDRTTASGFASLAAGSQTIASGSFSTAMGMLASTNSRNGSFVYGDVSTGGTGTLVEATASNQFVVRASGGFRLRTAPDLSTGCDLAAGALTCTGTIASASGGFQFPDGSVQTTANAGGVTDHGALTGLADDDHPQYLLADGVRASTNGFAVTGTFGSGAIPATGRGARLMWYPGKAAFRAGEVLAGSEWDDANVGRGSTAMGRNTTASGEGSIAMGDGATASGAFSVAMGALVTASNHSAVAVGNNARATGSVAVAIGTSTTASGASSVALGGGTTASGDNSTALGVLASTNSHRGAFVYGDASGSTIVNATADNSFVVRASGGFRLRSATDLSTGCDIAAGALTCTGAIASGSGGFRFPDGTVQTTAGAGGVTDHGALTGLTDDDHPQYLLTDGARSTTDGFAVTGTFGSGAIPASGAGTRLLWYPRKAAFRAGAVDAGQWDDASIGDYSTAMGLLTTASGAVSTALGSHTTASGLDATALGSFTTASGRRSLATGVFASTNNMPGSFVYGDESTFGTGVLVQPTAANQFVVRASGGVRLRTAPDLSTGCDIATGALTCTGTIASASGGFRFPDGSVQTEAATSGLSNVTIVSQGGTIPAGMLNSAVALSCPAGSKVTSGGFRLASPSAQVYSSYPSSTVQFGDRWIVEAANPSSADVGLSVFAVCVS